jgi:MoaA/NifB/PqqE/SkfB family radical SAM enzyme
MEQFYNKITTIQIEHSSMCNAACPQCLREWWDGDYSRINQTYIPTEFYETRIPQSVYDTLEKINFCGTVGDSCTAPNFIDVCRVIKNKNSNIELSISTNGGMRNPAWWAELATVLDSKDFVTFGIDGLGDTNDIYRVNVRWKKLMENAKAFIDAGGRAEWQFITFAHNEHQIKEAEELSKQMGFARFFTIYNNRFVVEEFTAKQSYGKGGVPLMPPKLEEEQSVLLRRDNPMPTNPNEWMIKAQDQCIKCQAIETNEAYIDAETHFLPCCYLAGAKFTLDPTDKLDGYYDLWTAHGGDKIKLDRNNWHDIVNGEFFSALTKTWTQKFGEGRLLVCSGVCSSQEVKFSEYKNQKHD